MMAHDPYLDTDKDSMKGRLTAPHNAILQNELEILDRKYGPENITINFRSIRRFHANRWEAYYIKCEATKH